MKPQKIFTCSKCDGQFQKWSGQCEQCQAWGTIGEEAQSVERKAQSSKIGNIKTFASLNEKSDKSTAIKGFGSLDRLLGGLVPGSVVLFGGEPGIGKSTLISQCAIEFSKNAPLLYVTGEESPQQVLLRLKRLTSSVPEQLSFLDETNAGVVAATIEKERPGCVIVDSIQSLKSDLVNGEPGSVNQIKSSAALLTEVAKKTGIPVILIGQLTKDGDLAGPKLLEHLVDTVIMMEGDRMQQFRVARLIKHRFGNTDESLILNMTEKGLEEVLDPSAALLEDRPEGASGTVVTCAINGGRPMLVELQALVNSAGYATPLRRASGLDKNRMSLLVAVLARRAGVKLHDHDVFMNAIGGIRVQDPGIDLALCLALASAKNDVVLPPDMIAFGEVGLAGELRPVPRLESRIKEAERMGFKTILLPKQKKMPAEKTAKLVACGNLREALQYSKI
jgi:DNA repair protein RadA/Sms